jgi:hypothetical protein
MERLRTPYIVPWHPWPGCCPSARTHERVRADASQRPGGRTRVRADMFASARTQASVRADAAVLPQVTSKRTLQCVQVTDAPAAIVRSSVRPSVRPSENVRVTTLDGSRSFLDDNILNATMTSSLAHWAPNPKWIFRISPIAIQCSITNVLGVPSSIAELERV